MNSRDRAVRLCAYFLVCLCLTLGVISAGKKVSAGFRPTRIKTELGRKEKPLFRQILRLSASSSCSQCTPQNAGPWGGPRSMFRRFVAASAAFPDCDGGSIFMGFLGSFVNGECSSVTKRTPSRIQSLG